MQRWLKAARIEVQAASLLPAVLGGVYGYYETGRFHLLYFVMTLIGVAFIHVGANLINEYYDHLSGTDALNETFLPGFSGGSRVIEDKLLSATAIKKGANICFSIGALFGLILSYYVGWPVLVIGVIGVTTSILYVSPKFNLTNKGFGELVVGIDFGVFIVMGAYFVQTQQFSWGAFIVSLPMALVVSSILMVNQIPDYTSDRLTGKITSAVRFGRDKSAKTLIGFLVLTLSIVMGSAAFGILPLESLLVLLVAPIVWKTARVLLRTYENPREMLPANLGVIQCHILTSLFVITALLPGLWSLTMLLPVLLSFKMYQVLQVTH